MDHIVTLNAAGKEIYNLVNGSKSMIIYGCDEKRNPYGVVSVGDNLYFVDDDDNSLVKAKGIASTIYYSYKLTEEESYEMVIRNQDRLILPDDLFYKWAGKKYLVLVGLREVEESVPFRVIRKNNSDPGEWKTVGNIEDSIYPDRVKVQYK